MRAGWQRRSRPSAFAFAAVQAVLPASCVLGKRGAGHRKVDAFRDCSAGAALHFPRFQVGQAAGLPSAQPTSLLGLRQRLVLLCGAGPWPAAGSQPAKPATDTSLEALVAVGSVGRPILAAAAFSRRRSAQAEAFGCGYAALYYTLLDSSHRATIRCGAGRRPAAGRWPAKPASDTSLEYFGCGSAAVWGGQSWPQPPFKAASAQSRFRLWLRLLPLCGTAPWPAAGSQPARDRLKSVLLDDHVHKA
jgi:hypothetical protein